MKIQIAIATEEEFKKHHEARGKILDERIIVAKIAKLREKIKKITVDTNKAMAAVPKGPQQSKLRATKKADGDRKKSELEREIAAEQKKRKTTMSEVALKKQEKVHDDHVQKHLRDKQAKYTAIGLLGGAALIGAKALVGA